MSWAVGAGLILSTHAIAIALVVIAHFDSWVPSSRSYGIACAQIARAHDTQAVDGTKFQFRNKIFLIIVVLAIDALTTHQCQFIVQGVFKEVAKDHQALVATIVHAIQRVRTLASQIEHGLRIDINQFELSG